MCKCAGAPKKVDSEFIATNYIFPVRNEGALPATLLFYSIIAHSQSHSQTASVATVHLHFIQMKPNHDEFKIIKIY